jgi:hypothetical protein
MEPEGSSSSSQDPANIPCPDPDKSPSLHILQEARYVSATNINWLLLFGETNSKIQSVGRMQSFTMLKQVVHIGTTVL